MCWQHEVSFPPSCFPPPLNSVLNPCLFVLLISNGVLLLPVHLTRPNLLLLFLSLNVDGNVFKE